MTLGSYQTARLLVHDWAATLDDPASRRALADELAAVLTDPVLRTLPPPLALSSGATAVSDWVDARAAESAVSTLRDRDTSALVGLLILAQPGDGPIIHIGYLLAQSAWGKGFATELLTGLVAQAHAFGKVTLIGGVGTDNPASARVLEKAGFICDTAASTGDTRIYTYAP